MRYICFLTILVLFTMCKTDKNIVLPVRDNAPIVIYKTKANYSVNLPVTMNESKEMIVSYPAPNDVFYNGALAFPVKLSRGYYLDNRGINKNTVYTSYTLEEYSKLESVPSLDELMKRIIDKDPFLEIYDCGTRGELNNAADLDKIIKSKFKGCTRIK